jgi:uncharacterized protein with FMN-binding domain
MRRSTAAAVGTLTGAALIIGVRLSVTPPAAPSAAPPPVNVADNSQPSASATRKSAAGKASSAPAKKKAATSTSGLKDGTFKGKGVQNPYGTVQVSLKVEGGSITDVAATYPLAGNSATINPVAIPKLKQEVLTAQNGKIAAVSGATYTSQAYTASLQSALDAAKA